METIGNITKEAIKKYISEQIEDFRKGRYRKFRLISGSVMIFANCTLCEMKERI